MARLAALCLLTAGSAAAQTAVKLGVVDVLSGPGSAAGQARLADVE